MGFTARAFIFYSFYRFTLSTTTDPFHARFGGTPGGRLFIFRGLPAKMLSRVTLSFLPVRFVRFLEWRVGRRCVRASDLPSPSVSHVTFPEFEFLGPASVLQYALLVRDEYRV